MDWLAALRLGIVIIASSLAGSLVFRALFKGTVKAKPNQIKPPKIFIYIGLITIVMMSFFVYLCFKNYNDIPLSLFFFFVSLMGIWLILHGGLWRIVLKENTFIYRNRLGQKKEYYYEEITSYRYLKYGTIRLYIDKKRINVDFCNSNIDVLNRLLYEKLRKRQTNCTSKNKRKRK